MFKQENGRELAQERKEEQTGTWVDDGILPDHPPKPPEELPKEPSRNDAQTLDMSENRVPCGDYVYVICSNFFGQIQITLTISGLQAKLASCCQQ